MIAVTEYSRKLEQAILIADQAIGEIHTFLSGVTQAQSERHPSTSAWSIGEVLHHLVLVTRGAQRLPDILARQPPDRFDYSAVVAKRGFDLPDTADPEKGGKGVAPERVQPSAGGDVRQLSNALMLDWEECKTRFRAIADRDLSRHYFEHYRLGPLNLYETIAFLGYHAQKHLGQMKRALASASA